MIRDPRVAFDMLFGAGSIARRIAPMRRATRRSILDWIASDVEEVRMELGAMDRPRLDQYLENVREIERRIEMVEAHNQGGEARALPDAPAGVPDSFAEHMRLMFDLQALALETGMTRVISFKLGRDSQNRVFPESGSSRPFHPASHHGNKEENILDFNKICQYRMSMLPYFLEKLQKIEVDGQNMLDRSMILWGSPMADGNIHNHRRCPMFLMGHAGGKLAGNLHIKAPDETPMANAMLTMLDMLDVPRDSFGDSNGRLELTSAAT